jgi:SulP family sulfate permease
MFDFSVESIEIRAHLTASSNEVSGSITRPSGASDYPVCGVGVSLALFLYKTSRPHIAEVGLVSGTEHFRNVKRHRVEISDGILSLRVDESLYFAIARALEDSVNGAVARRSGLSHVILQCSAVNAIDASTLESLEAIDARLKDAGIKFHLSEVKGPVMDKLARTHLLQHLSGRVFLTHYKAFEALK